MKKSQVIVLGMIGVVLIISVVGYFSILVGKNVAYAPKNFPSTSDRQKGEIGQIGACNVEPTCNFVGETVCTDSVMKFCGNFDADPCLEWGNVQNCVNGCFDLSTIPGGEGLGGYCNSFCSDSDGGSNPAVRGTASGSWYQGSYGNENAGFVTSFSRSDVCINANTLREYVCVPGWSDGEPTQYSSINCVVGTCVDGVCTPDLTIPDLTITSLSKLSSVMTGNGTCPPGYGGGSCGFFNVTFRAVVKNIGTGTASSIGTTNFNLQDYNSNGLNVLPFGGALSAGASRNVEVTFTNYIHSWNYPGSQILNVRTDYTNVVTESNENNNLRQQTFNSP